MAKKIYVFSYDLDADTADYKAVYEVIKKYNHSQCLESTWLIEADCSTKELAKAFEEVLKEGDRYFLHMLSDDEYWGRVYRKYGTWDWIKKVRAQ